MPKLFSVSLRSLRCEGEEEGNLEGKSIIVWGEDTIRTSRLRGVWGERLTNKQRDMLKLTRKAKGILIGVLLSDGWVRRQKKHWSPTIGIKQSMKNVKFLLEIQNEIGYLYPSRKIRVSSNMLRGERRYGVSMETRALPCLKEVVMLLYEEKKGKLVRRIQEELINEMNEIVLAYWIMGDGAKRNDGIILCTDGFTMREVVLLMNILRIRLGVESTIHKEKGRSRIYIKGREMRKVIKEVDKHVIKHFKYKLNNLV